MAKRRKKSRKVSRRRTSRMSGMGAIDFTNILGVVAGAIVAKKINDFIPVDETTGAPSIDSRIVSGGKLALGVALPMFVKGGALKNVMSGVGAGMVAVGGTELLKDFGVLNGLGLDNSAPLLDVFKTGLSGNVLGTGSFLGANDDLSVINGLDDLSVINGL
jgi:hypothetical protein